MVLTDKLVAIADAIRAKTGKTDALTLDQMPTEIVDIQVGGGETSDMEAQWIAAIEGTATVTKIPAGVTKIGDNAFRGCTNLALTSLPAGVISIGAYAFEYCTNLALTSLPAGVTSIGDYAFISCTGLKVLTFEGIPTSIKSSAFRDCTNLTAINVPWAEGEVANAPWGATNATINYNSGDPGDSGETVIVPETTFTVEGYDPCTTVAFPDDITNGTYKVYFDGVYYKDSSGYPGYGNPIYVLGPDHDQPFLIMPGEGIYAEDGTHTIKITQVQSTT